MDFYIPSELRRVPRDEVVAIFASDTNCLIFKSISLETSIKNTSTSFDTMMIPRTSRLVLFL